LGRTGLLVINR